MPWLPVSKAMAAGWLGGGYWGGLGVATGWSSCAGLALLGMPSMIKGASPTEAEHAERQATFPGGSALAYPLRCQSTPRHAPARRMPQPNQHSTAPPPAALLRMHSRRATLHGKPCSSARGWPLQEVEASRDAGISSPSNPSVVSDATGRPQALLALPQPATSPGAQQTPQQDPEAGRPASETAAPPPDPATQPASPPQAPAGPPAGHPAGARGWRRPRLLAMLAAATLVIVAGAVTGGVVAATRNHSSSQSAGYTGRSWRAGRGTWLSVGGLGRLAWETGGNEPLACRVRICSSSKQRRHETCLPPENGS